MRVRRGAATALALTLACLGTGGAALGVALTRSHPAHRAGPITSPTPRPSPTAITVQVNGAPIPAVDDSTVAAALANAGIKLRPGHYLSVVTQHRLGPDGRPARILVDGRPATLRTPVAAGDRITVRPGADIPEPTQVVRLAVPPPTSSPLYVGSRPGVARVVRGALSHEIVSSRVVRRPASGHLVRPGAVALTFDDGPWHKSTGQVLSLLEKHHVHATFCIIGRQVPTRGFLLRRMVRDGDELCDHTWDHDLALKSRPTPQIALDISKAFHAIVKATRGVAPMFFRAPGGEWSTRIIRAADAQHMVPLRWTVDTRDWSRPGLHAILHAVYQELRPGGVILMHDGGGDRSETVAALKILLHRLPKLGYHFVLPPDPAPVHN